MTVSGSELLITAGVQAGGQQLLVGNVTEGTPVLFPEGAEPGEVGRSQQCSDGAGASSQLRGCPASHRGRGRGWGSNSFMTSLQLQVKVPELGQGKWTSGFYPPSPALPSGWLAGPCPSLGLSFPT